MDFEVEVVRGLESFRAAALENLRRYIADGSDPAAIYAALTMIREFTEEIEKYKKVA